MPDNDDRRLEDIALRLKSDIGQLCEAERYDLLAGVMDVPLLERLRIEKARGNLSRLVVTQDYRLLLPEYENREIELQPVHKAVYLLFLAHPEGIQLKNMIDYREELEGYYRTISGIVEEDKIRDTIEHLINPLDNAMNEKCSRIKRTVLGLMDEYRAEYYFISSRMEHDRANSTRVWYKRLKVIGLPRELVVWLK